MTDGFDCGQLEAALREGELEAARRHAETCDACRRELEAWDAVSAFGASLHREWESPELWPDTRRQLGRRPSAWSGWFAWRFAAIAAALVLALAAGVGLEITRQPATPVSADYLTDRTLREVMDAEEAYVRSIEKLSRLAGATLARDTSPGASFYREKLVLLDAAIRDLREAAAENGLNAAVQTQLVSLYHEKQQTLQEVLRYAQSNAQRL